MASQPEVGLDAGADFVELERLGHVVGGAHRERRDLVLCLARALRKITGISRSALVGLEAAAHLVPVHLRHHDVEEDQVGRLALDGAERAAAPDFASPRPVALVA